MGGRHPYNIGDLAAVSDAGTNDFLQQLIQDAYVWVGGFHDENTTSWMWSDGTPWNYENWYPGQPNNGDGVQTHLAFNVDSSGFWNDEKTLSGLESEVKYLHQYLDF